MGRQLNSPCFRELAWHRPFTLEAVLDVFTQLAASNIKSPIVFEARGVRGRMHYLIGAEQEETGMFPLTAWIVPTEKRKDTLLKCIRQAFDKKPKLFAVITMDELEHLIRDGGDNSMLC